MGRHCLIEAFSHEVKKILLKKSFVMIQNNV